MDDSVLSTLSEEQRIKLMKELNANGSVDNTVIDNREESTAIIALIQIPGMEDFELVVDVKNMDTGSYLAVTEGTMTQRMKFLGGCIMKKGKHLSKEDGYAIVCDIPLKHLAILTNGLKDAIVGANLKN